MQPLLKLTDVNFSYHSPGGETSALSRISFQVEEGEFLAIIGPSGCGNAMYRSRRQCPSISSFVSSSPSLPQSQIFAVFPSHSTRSKSFFSTSLFFGTGNL